MKVKYQITMEVEVEVNPKTELISNTTGDLAIYAKEGFESLAYEAVVNKVEVSRIGATGIAPVVNQPPHSA